MALTKRNCVSGETVITATNLNDIQDSIIALEGKGLTKEEVVEALEYTPAKASDIPTTDISANTAARHSHSNKDILDNIAEITSISGGSVTGGANALVTKEVLDATSQLIMDEIPSELHATGFVARYTAEDANAENSFVQRIQTVTDKSSYDYVIVFGGINDYIQNIEMGGDTGKTDKATYFKPTVDWFFDYLVKNFVQARIVVLLPLRTYNIYKNTAGGSQTTGYYQQAYSDYIKEVAKSYCLPILNLTEESGFYPFITEFRSKWTLIPSGYTTADGVHPNKEYQEKYLAPMIKEFLSRYI